MIVTTAVRRKAFRAALAVTDQSVASWCKNGGVGKYHLGLVLRGKRKSDRLNKEVDAFVVRVLPAFVAEYMERRTA